MKKRARGIEIFSLSSIDLFAAAMGAFALLTIVLMPYYQNVVVEKTPESNISDKAFAAELSLVETKEKKKALERKRDAQKKNVSDIKSEETKLLADLRAAEATMMEKMAKAEAARAVPLPEPPEPIPDPKPAPVEAEPVISFRFLGMKTKKDDIVVALDMNKCMGGHEESILRSVERVIESLQDNHAVRIVGFQQTDSGPRVSAWPNSGLRRINSGARREAVSYASGLTRQFGGSASMLDAFKKMLDGPGQAIFLISDGLPNPRANNGLSPKSLAREITRINAGRKEIHTVVVGNYFDYKGTVDFMERLSESNNGQFMALASGRSGVCD